MNGKRPKERRAAPKAGDPVDITPRLTPGRLIVQGYGGGGFRIGGARYKGAVLVFSDQAAAWPVTDLDDAGLDTLAPVLEAEPPVELLIFGCGARPRPLGAALRRALMQRSVAVELMDTGAACRTFNVLAGEDRRIAAALLPVP